MSCILGVSTTLSIRMKCILLYNLYTYWVLYLYVYLLDSIPSEHVLVRAEVLTADSQVLIQSLSLPLQFKELPEMSMMIKRRNKFKVTNAEHKYKSYQMYVKQIFYDTSMYRVIYCRIHWQLLCILPITLWKCWLNLVFLYHIRL